MDKWYFFYYNMLRQLLFTVLKQRCLPFEHYLTFMPRVLNSISLVCLLPFVLLYRTRTSGRAMQYSAMQYSWIQRFIGFANLKDHCPPLYLLFRESPILSGPFVRVIRGNAMLFILE